MTPLLYLGILFVTTLLFLLPLHERKLRFVYVGASIVNAMAALSLAVPAFTTPVASGPYGSFVANGVSAFMLFTFALVWLALVAARAVKWGLVFRAGSISRTTFCTQAFGFSCAAFFMNVVFLAAAPVLQLVGLFGIILTTMLVAGRLRADHDLRTLRQYTMLSLASLGATLAGYLIMLFAINGSNHTFGWTYADLTRVAVGSGGGIMHIGFLVASIGLVAFSGLMPFSYWKTHTDRIMPLPLRVLSRVFVPTTAVFMLLSLANVVSISFGDATWSSLVLLTLGAIVVAGAALLAWHQRGGGFVYSLVPTLLGLILCTAGYGPAGSIAALMVLPGLLFGASALHLYDEGRLPIGNWTRRLLCWSLLGLPGFPIFIFLFFSLGYGLQQHPLISALVTALAAWGMWHGYWLGDKDEDDRMHEPRHLSLMRQGLAAFLLVVSLGFGIWFIMPSSIKVLVAAGSTIAQGI